MKHTILIIVLVAEKCLDYEETVASILSNKISSEVEILVMDLSTAPSPSNRLRSGSGIRIPEVKLLHVPPSMVLSSVNQAVRHRERDLVLLAPGARVFEHWLQCLWECAYSHPRVATVTAISNVDPFRFTRAEYTEKICRVHQLDSPDLARTILKASSRQPIEVPLAAWPAVYVRWESIMDVDGFDESQDLRRALFDFSCRCTQAGYIHLLNGAVYAYQRPGAWSVSESEGITAFSEIKGLQERYPYFAEMITQVPLISDVEQMQEDNFRAISFNCLKLSSHKVGRKKNVLRLIHNVGGGSTHLFHQLTSELDYFDDCYSTFFCAGWNNYFNRSNPNFLVIFNSARPDYPRLRLDLSNIRVEPQLFKHYSYKARDIYGKILDEFQIDIVHVHHFINHYLDIVAEAKKRGIPIIGTAHDYYTVCPSIQMFSDSKGFWCDTSQCLTERGGCDLQTIARYARFNGSIQSVMRNWRKHFGSALGQFDYLVFPDESVKEVFVRAYPDLAEERMRVIPHGTFMDYEISEDAPESSHRVRHGNCTNVLRVASLANHVSFKGLKTLNELLRLSVDDEIQWHLYGPVRKDQIDAGATPAERIVVHGHYERKQIIRQLTEDRIDVVLILSEWPETFCHTISEAALAKIPVVGRELGAQGNRIKKYDLGWTVSPCAPTQHILELLRHLKDNRDALRAKALSVRPLPTIRDAARQYSILYDAVLAARDNEPPNWAAAAFTRTDLSNMRVVEAGREILLQPSPVRNAPPLSPREKILGDLFATGNALLWNHLNPKDLLFFTKNIFRALVRRLYKRLRTGF